MTYADNPADTGPDACAVFWYVSKVKHLSMPMKSHCHSDREVILSHSSAIKQWEMMLPARSRICLYFYFLFHFPVLEVTIAAFCEGDTYWYYQSPLR